jgi:hypothetical protein
LGRDAEDCLADGRFGLKSSSNDRDFQRRFLNERRVAKSLHETGLGRNAKMQSQQRKFFGIGVQSALENAMQSVTWKERIYPSEPLPG